MLKLKLQYSSYLMWRTDTLEKTPMLGKIKGGRRRGPKKWEGWMVSPTEWTWVWVGFRSWWWTGKPGMLQSIASQSWTQLSNWTELNWYIPFHILFHYGLSQDFEYSSLCYTVEPYCLSILYIPVCICYPPNSPGAPLVAQLVKNLSTMQETLVQFLGREDPLEKGWATHSSILGLPWWLRQ